MSTVSGYIESRLATCHPKILRWQGREATGVHLEGWLQAHLARLRDEFVLEGFAAHCPVEGAAAQDYAIRTIRLGGIGSLLAGIHFYSGHISMPFVHVTAADFELDPGTLAAVSRLLREEFAVFRPERFRIWLDSDCHPLVRMAGAEADQWVLAGRRDEISLREAPDQLARISLSPDPELASYPDFERCYREFNHQHPGTGLWNTAVDRETLEQCSRDGGYFRVHIDGEAGGWIAARRCSDEALSGWCMADELLEPAHRGKGLAAAMQRAFLECLPGRDQLVWGTVDARNAASLGTARRVGREVVGGYLFLPLL